MALNIDDPEVEGLARMLADLTGESVTEAFRISLEERLNRTQRRRKPKELLVDELMKISRRSASLPVYDDRTPDEILGYDENGLPT